MLEETQWLSPDDAAARVRKQHGRRCSAGYLAKLRHLGKGPRFYRRNGAVAYQIADVDAWAQSFETSGPFEKASDARHASHLEAVA